MSRYGSTRRCGASVHELGVLRHEQHRAPSRRAHRLGATAAAVLVAGIWLFGCHGQANAQITECAPMAYHHAGCDDGSGPDVGKWAWNPGEPSNWPGLGVAGNVHWWVQYSWSDPLRHAALRSRDGDLPSLEAAFYDTEGHCGCDVDVLSVRVRHHLYPPALNQVLFRAQQGDCPGSHRSVLKAYFTRTGQVFPSAKYDLSVDARALALRETGGQANLFWEADGTASPNGGCPANPRARVWLGGLKHCIDLRLRSADPSGICCSTSFGSPNCGWVPCFQQ